MRIYIKSASTDTANRIKIARTATDQKLLSRLAYDPNRTVRDIVSKNSNLPEHAMRQLAKDPSVDIRRRIASKTNDQKVFQILSTDIDEQVRIAVATRCEYQNILEDMIFDESEDVRKILAERIQDPEILTMMVDDESADVRYVIASTCRNPEILQKLTSDSDADVSAIAKKRLANLRNVKLHPADRFRGKYQDSEYSEWSISPFEVESLDDIGDEIDEVIDIAVDKYAENKGGSASVQLDGYGYDSATTFTMLFRDASGKQTSYSADIDEILAPATSNNRKEKCIQNVIRWLNRTFG